MITDIEELLQAEALISDIEGNHRHPANNPRHLNHKQASTALQLLKSKAAQVRANLEAQRYFHL
jgi:hypothetical protein